MLNLVVLNLTTAVTICTTCCDVEEQRKLRYSADSEARSGRCALDRCHMVSVVTLVATGHSCGHVSVATIDRVCCYAAVCMSVGFINFLGLT